MFYFASFLFASLFRMVASNSMTLDHASFISVSDLIPDKRFLLDSFYGISRRMCILECTKSCECQSAGFGQQTCMLFSITPAAEMNNSPMNQPFQHNAHFTLFFRFQWFVSIHRKSRKI